MGMSLFLWSYCACPSRSFAQRQHKIMRQGRMLLAHQAWTYFQWSRVSDIHELAGHARPLLQP